ncbi:aldehyde dehydrogenase family protein [Thermolongibacillus altinsuensis]|jgi:acyl-CoA reductase-like NAD-dependent aldehyde dehydrogenase|uniref:aldehyde dehydrogenase family protein n=1 Tax=Thermolongibacillus altinsuensis TaxID=575256 RepID=UPI00242A2DA1|nr:aldehyde dehydrogenase family protein [Thermolongibacillus altinsuensis]GMB09580.1 aldehyde dehydrogenase [Thermolongibacillus altinsuensis]
MKSCLFINGEEKVPTNTYVVYNPHTGEVIGEVADSTEEEMRTAIEAASQAFYNMKTLPSWKRADILYKAASLLEQEKEEVASIITKEASKPISAARVEVERSIQTLQFSAEEAKRIGGEYIPLDAAKGGEGRDAYTIYEPLGVIGAITPFNFPLNLTVHKVGPAIAAGNTIVVKPAEQTPYSSLKLAEILTRAGLPKGAINVVPGDGPRLGKVFLEDERIKKISFTGSPSVGKLIKSQAGLKKVTLELGSNSALYIDESVKEQLSKIVPKAVIGAFSYNGQVCISTQRIYVHQRIAQEFIDLFVKETKNLSFGDPFDEKTVVTSLINKKSQKRIMEWIDEAVNRGAKVLTGGVEIGNGIAPTVLTNVPADCKVSCQEVFGPLVIIEEVENEKDALKKMNNSEFGLNAGVFTNRLNQAIEMAHGLEVGQVFINDVPTTRFDHMPYGGVKSSGYGHEGVKYAIREMMQMKMISLNYKI